MTPILKRRDGTTPLKITRQERNHHTLDALVRIDDAGTRNINVRKDEALLAYEVALREQEEKVEALTLDLQQAAADAKVEKNKTTTQVKNYHETIKFIDFAHQAFVTQVSTFFNQADAQWDPRTTQNADMRRLRRALDKETSQ